jgi:hypothetical protein
MIASVYLSVDDRMSVHSSFIVNFPFGNGRIYDNTHLPDFHTYRLFYEYITAEIMVMEISVDYRTLPRYICTDGRMNSSAHSFHMILN